MKSFFKRDFIKKRLLSRCFPLKFVKFLKTSVLKNICEGLLLYIQLKLLVGFGLGENIFFKIVKSFVTFLSKTTLFTCIYFLFMKNSVILTLKRLEGEKVGQFDHLPRWFFQNVSSKERVKLS